MRITVYVHGSKENAYDACKKAGLSEEACMTGSYLGYEIEATYEVNDKGEGILVAVNGIDLPAGDP